MNRLVVLSVVFCVLAAMGLALPGVAHGGPTIGVYTDKDVYESGDTIEVSFSCSNDDEDIIVSVYFGFFQEGGEIEVLGPGGWSTSFRPWIAQITLPSGCMSGRIPLLWYHVPSLYTPGIMHPGRYNFAAVLTRAGTSDWVSDLSIASFWYVEEGSDIHGGSITEDTIISGDIHLTSDLVVEQGAVLTILPPARIRSAKDVGIVVHGGLIAEGDVQDSIIFEGLEPYEDWNNITFGMTADDEECRIVRCLIRGGSGKLARLPWYENCYGGAIFCYKSSPHIESNTITGNWAEAGGGIASDAGSPTIVDNVIIGNHTPWYSGTAISCSGGYPIISGNTIIGNWAEEKDEYNDQAAVDILEGEPVISDNIISGNMGPGIICADSDSTISNNTIRSNTGIGIACGGATATISGNTVIRNRGGISCFAGSITITDNVVSGNIAPSWTAGGIDLGGKGMVSGNIIIGNEAEQGGGVSCTSYYSAMNSGNKGARSNEVGRETMWETDSLVIFNNLIAGNSATQGGAIYFDSAYISLSVLNNTIVGNSADEGGGIFRTDWCDASLTISDCILWGNGDDLFGCANPYDCSVTYCCIEDDDAGEGNIHENPILVTGPLGDYYLHPDSPCIDAGSRSAEDAGLSDRTTQADGTPDTGTVDMGSHYPVP